MDEIEKKGEVWTVVATKLGVYAIDGNLQRRYPEDHTHKLAGAPFQVYAKDFSKNWMKRIDGPNPEPDIRRRGRPKKNVYVQQSSAQMNLNQNVI